MATSRSACSLSTVKKRKKRRMTAACVPQIRTARISATFSGTLLIHTPLREMLSSSTVSVSVLFNHSDKSLCVTDKRCTQLMHQSNDFCVDDSGRWGRGGLFTALEVRSDEPRKKYESAGKMKGRMTQHSYLRCLFDK